MTWGGFNWKLNFRWYRVPQRELERRKGDRSLPVRTPTMAGGLFSIDRDYQNTLVNCSNSNNLLQNHNLTNSKRTIQLLKP